MPTQLSSDIQYERFLKLPEQLRDAIASVNTSDVVFEIGRTHRLNIEKIGVLGQETGLVMSGISPAKEFVSALETELKIPREEAGRIASEINEKLFVPIREYMKGFHGDGWERDLPKIQRPVSSAQTSEQRAVNSEQVAKPFDSAQGKPEPLIIRPLGQVGEERIGRREQRVGEVAPHIAPAKQEMPPSEKERPAPIVNPIIRGFDGEGTRDSALGTRMSEQESINNQPTISNQQKTPVPDYYEEAKKKVEEEIAALKGIGDLALGTGVSEQDVKVGSQQETPRPLSTILGTSGSEQAVTSQQQPPVEAKKVIEPFRPSPYVISVGDRGESVESREQETPRSDSQPSQSFGGQAGQAINNQQLPPIAPVIAVTPPGSSEQSSENREQRVENGPTEPPKPPIPTNPAPNPIRLDKKIPKPPAPEKYEADPYKEPIE